MSVQVSYKKQITFGIICLVIVLIILEAVIVTYDYFTKQCKFMISDVFDNLDQTQKLQICRDFESLVVTRYPFPEMKPNQDFPTIHINNVGFRGSDFSPIKPENTYRIFMIGGSTTFGSASTSDSTTIPSYLQQKFNNENSEVNIEIINAGISGAFSFTEIQLLKNKIFGYEPDLIIVYDGVNDVTEQYPTDNYLFEEKKKNSFFEEIANLLSNYRTIQVFQKFLLYSNDQEWNERLIYELEEYDIDKKAQIWKNNWNEICQISKEKDFEMLITIHPIAGTSDRKLTDFERMKFIQHDGQKIINYLGAYALALEKLDPSCDNVADLRNVFNGIDGPLFYDHVHVSDRGNKIVAEKLFELTKQIVFSKIDASL